MKPVPVRPSLEFDRKQAKRLLAAVRAGDPGARNRLAAIHPRYVAGLPADTSAISLSDAQLVIAREYGFASWTRWKQYVEFTSLDPQSRINAFLMSACSDGPEFARRMLEADPDIVNGDICAAAAAGRSDVVDDWLKRDKALATRKLGPLVTGPLVYACQSRLFVTEPARREGIVGVVRSLLDAGANPNDYFLLPDEDNPAHRQTAIYGAAGINNDESLTRLLLEAGADANDGVCGSAGETLYHAAEFENTTCLRLLLAANVDKAAKDYCLARALDFDFTAPALAFLEFGAEVDYRVPWFDNQTHLMKALKKRAPIELLSAMIERAGDLHAADERGVSTWRYAVRAGLPQACQLLKAKGVITDDSAIDQALGACMSGDAAALDRIVDANGPPVLETHDYELLSFATRRRLRQVVPLLVRLGIPVDAGAMPALHEACFIGDLEGVQQLLALGADPVEKTNAHGGTALGTTIYGSLHCHDVSGGPMALPPELVAPREYAAVVELLIERGAKLPEEPVGSRAVMEVLQRYR